MEILGIAVLRILAQGFPNIKGHDFTGTPSTASIETEVKNLIRLGAIVTEDGVHHKVTENGRMLLKLGIEPKLGMIILKCCENDLGREGVVLIAVMANFRSVFYRAGEEEEKHKSDCLKMHFCHQNGDLFTLLSVYREWERVSRDRRNQWCWDNSINAKTMCRGHETVQEMELCLRRKLNIIIPSFWHCNTQVNTKYDQILRDTILFALAENVAMYSGMDSLGYEVASTGRHIRLHPSCSLLIFGGRPTWVVFGEISATTNQYLACVTAVDFESLHTLQPPPFDISHLCSRKLQRKAFTGFGTAILKKLCGKSNFGLKHLLSHIKDNTHHDRIGLEVSVDLNQVSVCASSEHMEQVSDVVIAALERERNWLQNECLEKYLYPGRHAMCPLALFGAGAEIRHLEVENSFLSVDIYLSGAHDVNDRDLLSYIEAHTSGRICAVHRFRMENSEKWGRVTFLTPAAADKATKLRYIEDKGISLRVIPSRSTLGGTGVKENAFGSCRGKKLSLRGPASPPDLMKSVVEKFGPDLHGLKEQFPGSDFTLDTRNHIIYIDGSLDLKQKVEELISFSPTQFQTDSCPICLCDIEDGYHLGNCNHGYCRRCLREQSISTIKGHSGFPMTCAHEGCKAMLLLVDLKSVLSTDEIDQLFRASLGSFVLRSVGKYRFCPSPDCPSVYRVSKEAGFRRLFYCGACSVKTCTRCHFEYHPHLTCDANMRRTRDPDYSVKEWMRSNEDARQCPCCKSIIEKLEGCSHIECRCGRHICWLCMSHFGTSDECYAHMTTLE